MWSLRRCFLVGLLVLPACFCVKVVEDTFSRIKNTPGEQLVVFYRSSDSEAADVLKTVDKVAKKVTKLKDKSLTNFSFKKCDGDLSTNKADFEEAQFTQGTFIFTSTPIEGIEKYSGPRTVAAMVEHIRHKYLPYTESDVLKFEDDEDWFWTRFDAHPETRVRPVFLKFYEEWCEHCKRMRLNFMRAAGYFKGGIPGSPELPGVDFMEVHCSRNDDTTAFCVRHGVRSYPVLMLFTGEKKVTFSDDKTITAYGEFFKTHLTALTNANGSPSSSVIATPHQAAGKRGDAALDDDDEETGKDAPPTPPAPATAKPHKPLPSRRVDPSPSSAAAVPADTHTAHTHTPAPAVSEPATPAPARAATAAEGEGRSEGEEKPAGDRPLGRFSPAAPTKASEGSLPVESRLSALESSMEEIKTLLRAALAK